MSTWSPSDQNATNSTASRPTKPRSSARRRPAARSAGSSTGSARCSPPWSGEYERERVRRLAARPPRRRVLPAPARARHPLGGRAGRGAAAVVAAPRTGGGTGLLPAASRRRRRPPGDSSQPVDRFRPARAVAGARRRGPAALGPARAVSRPQYARLLLHVPGRRHFLAIRGARQGLRKVAWRLQPSAALGRLCDLGGVPRPSGWSTSAGSSANSD